MNIDWSLCQGLKSTFMNKLWYCISYYDVNCLYVQYLKMRVANNPHLQIDPKLKIVPGIGLLHVTEHKLDCVPCFAPTYIKGAGLVAGKIIECLWSSLNGCTHSTQTTTNANRAEIQ
jgi:Kyakuja-Dileera-Zisupton transposase